MTEYEATFAGGPPAPPAPCSRATREELERQIRMVASSPILGATLRAFSGVVLVVNRERQIVCANTDFLSTLGMDLGDRLIGSRPGEAFCCIHSHTGPGGCGTSEDCRDCGALLALLESQNSCRQAKGECLLTTETKDGRSCLEFSVMATPVVIEGEAFTVLCMHDISDRKRRHALERIFFHDVLNTITGLRGWSELLKMGEESLLQQALDSIILLTERLEEEVHGQRELTAAEDGTIITDMQEESAAGMLKSLGKSLEAHDCAEGKTLRLEPSPEVGAIVTDRGLALRVLTNMLKNAFEASRKGETVTAGFKRAEGCCRFYVTNPGAIPPATAGRIFQRSFSTKATSGRGLGTYSMKLFGEKYLGGKVWFETSPTAGTTFYLDLPLS